MYKVGDKLQYIGNSQFHLTQSIWTKGKTYEIHSCDIFVYKIKRDDGEIGIWWKNEFDEFEKNFISIKEQRKKKLEKLQTV